MNYSTSNKSNDHFFINPGGALCKHTNGFCIGEVDVFGLGTMRQVALDDGNYLMIAEKSGGSLSFKQSRRTTKLKYHSYEDETDVRVLGDQFIPALGTFLKIE